MQKARERAEGESETLRQRTEELENRILDEKLKSVEQLNSMNDANEQLRQRLQRLEKSQQKGVCIAGENHIFYV